MNPTDSISRINHHRYPFLLLFALPLMLLLSSCGVRGVVIQDISHVDPGFSLEAVEAGGLSMLPVVASSGLENFRRPFATLINAETDSLVKNFMPLNETLGIMNSNGLISDFNNAVMAYRETSVLDRSLVDRLYEATGNNYFLYVHLLEPTDEREQRFNNYSERYYDREQKTAGAVALVWSAADGDVVWEGTTRIEVVSGQYTTIVGDDKERIERIAKALVSSLFE